MLAQLLADYYIILKFTWRQLRLFFFFTDTSLSLYQAAEWFGIHRLYEYVSAQVRLYSGKQDAWRSGRVRSDAHYLPRVWSLLTTCYRSVWQTTRRSSGATQTQGLSITSKPLLSFTGFSRNDRRSRFFYLFISRYLLFAFRPVANTVVRLLHLYHRFYPTGYRLMAVLWYPLGFYYLFIRKW